MALADRFIPTCVGNTVVVRGIFTQFAVHPHVRGEYITVSPMPDALLGSSPRAWGIQQTERRLGLLDRFIPTCVGNTRTSPDCEVACAVHPHVRGEYFQNFFSPAEFGGSSPRAWGIHPQVLQRKVPLRFIPTCVGNTPSWSGGFCVISVHPHVRGEYGVGEESLHQSSGSSPRAWGIRRDRCPGGTGHRFIPTCVGNTVW